jgi:uncharacterized peroxidase-related enzyme
VVHHRAGLARLLREEGLDAEDAVRFGARLVEHVEDGSELDPKTTRRERALLVYAAKLTRAPAAMRRSDVDALRQAGLDDGEILDANQVVAYFAYANRVADGLGIELEDWHD